jgi:hypothetical protein
MQPRQERAMAQSQRYGQMSPIAVCVHEGKHVVVDGFKRLHAARTLKGLNTLRARRLELDPQGAKAAIYNLNRIGQRPAELEEAWIVHALVREDGMTQVEAAQPLGRHKSWVIRRLALLERLCEEARQELRLGLLTPSLARQLTRLPIGNQAESLTTAREASLTSNGTLECRRPPPRPRYERSAFERGHSGSRISDTKLDRKLKGNGPSA